MQRFHLLRFAPLSGLLLAGCVGSTEPASPSAPDAGDVADATPDAAPLPVDSSRLLCDGRPGSQLWFLSGLGGWSPQGVDLLARQHGDGYFVIDGSCNYWVSSAAGVLATGWTGHLDDAQRDAIERDLHYQSLAAMGDQWCEAFPDGGFSLVGDDAAQVRCGGPYLPGTPSEVAAMFDAIGSTMETLRSAGVPQTGPIRLYLTHVRPESQIDRAPVDWPLAIDPESLTVEDPGLDVPEEPFPSPSLIDDLDDAAALRAAKAADQAGAQYAQSTLMRGPDGTLYWMNARDVLPFEDERGFLTVPWL
jgi:hypothetical protein